MLIQKIQGGLGNQMFQYAFIKALSLRNKVDFKLDISEYETYFRPYELEVFNIQKKYTNKNEIPFYERIKLKNKYLSYIYNTFVIPIFSKLNKNHVQEQNGRLDTCYLNNNKGYFEGFFHNLDYFDNFEDEIKKDFSFCKSLSKKNLEFLDTLSGRNTVSVHIRRGDYLKNPDVHPVMPVDYYNKCIGYIYDRIENPVFLFFSDDQNRVKNNFKGDNYYFIDWNIGGDSWQDMALMNECKHNIIAVSSFSWWGARLNKNPNKIVIAPKIRGTENNTFFPNVIPRNWKRM